ncbi:MAG: hypothetical protein RL723_1176 [Actinomycetota bacterium]
MADEKSTAAEAKAPAAKAATAPKKVAAPKVEATEAKAPAKAAAAKAPAKKAEKPAAEKSSVLKLHHLRPAPGSKKDRTRVGRGEGSKGKTSGRRVRLQVVVPRVQRLVTRFAQASKVVVFV